MKIRSTENLIDFLDSEIAWRKRELTTIKNNVEKSRQTLELTAIRSGIVLLYAHWEGFLKIASEAYLDFVIRKGLKYNQLKSNFVAISIKQKLRDFEQTNKVTIQTQIIDFILNNHDEKAIINKENVIKTGSNLKSSNMREMMTAIGLDFTKYDTKSNLIDEQLLNYRNTIAHGQYLEIDANGYIMLHDEIRLMIESYKEDIENAAINSHFSKTS